MTPSLQITGIRLRVADLDRSIDFYCRQLGFQARGEFGGSVHLAPSSDGATILTLEESVSAAPRDAAGLFHAALLFPSRAALAGWLRSAASQGVEFDGLSDHGVSEAIYFSDPDGNGLEFYADRPRDVWPRQNGGLAMVTRPLALQSLLREAATTMDEPLKDTAWGHLHLRVTNLARSETFYRTALKLEVTQANYPGARFLAADGYHHHLGINIWGHPRLPQPEGAIGLAEATFAHAGATNEQMLIDPDGIHLRWWNRCASHSTSSKVKGRFVRGVIWSAAGARAPRVFALGLAAKAPTLLALLQHGIDTHRPHQSPRRCPRQRHRVFLMARSVEEFERLLAAYEKLRRTVRWHLIFLLICIVAALLLRRALNYPPMLSWVVFAVPALVFGADFVRLLVYRIKLSRYRASDFSR